MIIRHKQTSYASYDYVEWMWDTERHVLTSYKLDFEYHKLTDFSISAISTHCYLDTNEEEICRLGVHQKSEYDSYMMSKCIDIDIVGKEIADAILQYYIERYDAKYFAYKCVLPQYDPKGLIYIKAIALLAEFRDTGLESLFMVDPHWVMSHIKSGSRQWLKLTNAQKKLCINTMRQVDEDTKTGIKSLGDIFKYAADNTFIIRRRLNRGLPDACKITQKDLRWLQKHKADTPYGRRQTTTFMNYARRYTKYLEYEHTLERDVTETYWRYNRDWVNILQEVARQQRRVLDNESPVTRRNRLITESYANKCIAPQSINGFTFEVTNDAAKWRKQAKVLHQCIVSMSYYNKKKSTIILCTKDNEPYATFEVREHEIVQSYKDEHSMHTADIYVEDACTKACLKYIQQNNI